MFHFCFTQVIVHRTGVTRRRFLDSEWVPLAEELCRGDNKAVTVAAAASPGVKAKVLEEIVNDVKRECKQMCARDSESLFKKARPEDIANWSYDEQERELIVKSPMFMTFLQAAGKNDERLSLNKSKTEEAVQRGIVEAAAVLLFCRSREMKAHQTLTALQLHAGLATQATFDRLHKRFLCMEHTTVTALQDRYLRFNVFTYFTSLGRGICRGPEGWPLGGVARGIAPLRKKILHLVS